METPEKCLKFVQSQQLRDQNEVIHYLIDVVQASLLLIYFKHFLVVLLLTLSKFFDFEHCRL